MGDFEEVYVTDLFKKHKGKENYKGFYIVGKRIYQDDGGIVNKSIALDRESLEVLRAKIMAILIDELPPKKKSNPNIKNQMETQTDKIGIIFYCSI